MAILRIPDPNEPPFPYNFPVSDNEDTKMLILLVEEISLTKRIDDLEKRVRYLESERNRNQFSKKAMIMGWKEKDWKKNRNHKGGESRRQIEEDMLRMQGLIVCPNCDLTYSLYQPKCPHCDEPNKSHYPAKV